MDKLRALKLTGALAAVGTAAALIGTAVTGTGAYFSDRHNGSVNGTFGQVSVTVSNAGGGSSLDYQWANIRPGEWQTAQMTIKNTGSQNQDVYLAFDDANGEWSQINTLGTYGEAKVYSQLTGTKDYNNLNNKYAQGTPPNTGQTNACGDATPAISYLPAQNFLGQLAPGQSEVVQFQFRYSACLGNNTKSNGSTVTFNNEGTPAFKNPLNFAIMATQPGVKPSDPHNRDATSTNGVIYSAPSATHQ